ncbi:transferrin-binding protein-like solute binding protein [Novosphingobium sp.]|uniref:transferrin-binding protein-like solute binding protein n=1 Tax=Novosphingobium sp. TaxID=1874826 RepID=UPI0038BD3B99
MHNRFAVMVPILLLGGCGDGGGGGIASTPVAPSPVNTTITDLKVSQSFQNDAAGVRLALDLTTKTGISGQIRPNSLTISYDAGAKSYSVSADGRSESFASANLTSSAGGETKYKIGGAGNSSYLTILTTPYNNPKSNQYAGLGYWQKNATTGMRQDTDFYIFTYGLPTAATAMPRTGLAGFRTDVFGVVSTPGEEPRSFLGQGDFSVDLAAGVFATRGDLTETTLVTNQGVSGGGIEFTGAGHLSSSAATFAGNAVYEGWFGTAGGALSGRFYGPGAEELGGAFSGANANGMTVVGGFTGQRDTTVQPQNLTLTNLTRSQLFYTQYIDNLVGQLNWQNAETFTYGPPTSDMYGGQFTSNDKVTSKDPNFTEYRKTFGTAPDSQDVILQLYKPGGSNSELALTYASFVHYQTAVPYGTERERRDRYGAYGLETSAGLLSGKTGTGSYRGVVYGTGKQNAASVFYDVKGTSQFAVDFGQQSYAGALAMKGTPTAGGTVIDFGSYDVAGRLTINGVTGTLTRGGVEVGQFAPHFYGPDGEEIAAPFALTAPTGAAGAGITITGVAAAKRQ